MERKYLEYLKRSSALQDEVIESIQSLGPKDADTVPCFENVTIQDNGRVLVDKIHCWGVTDTKGKGHNYEGIEIDTLIHILRNLELHPPQK